MTQLRASIERRVHREKKRDRYVYRSVPAKELVQYFESLWSMETTQHLGFYKKGPQTIWISVVETLAVVILTCFTTWGLQKDNLLLLLWAQPILWFFTTKICIQNKNFDFNIIWFRMNFLLGLPHSNTQNVHGRVLTVIFKEIFFLDFKKLK